MNEYLEVGFWFQGQAVAKESTVFELTEKYQKDDQLVIEFTLEKKTFGAAAGLKVQSTQHNINNNNSN